MVQRHAEDAFAAGAFVFPGGVLEEADSGAESLALSTAFSPAQARAALGTVDSPERALGFYLAAIRETFEEVGVLLARTAAGELWQPHPGKEPTWRAVRAALREGRLGFAEWLGREGLRPAADALVYFAHWITPEGRPKRFDTRFFLASVDGRVPVKPDQAEIVGYRWIAPAEAVAAYHHGTMRMVNVTVKNLELLAGFDGVQAALAGLRNRAVRPIRPKLVPLSDGGVRIVHPWEPGYDAW
jgi:8-oxo-dGTP pyrophosphatase MutT (NUDIX family)